MGRAQTTSARQDSLGWNHERQRNREAAAYLVQAMAHQQLKRILEARVALTTGMNTIKTRFPEVDSSDLGREWQDWPVA